MNGGETDRVWLTVIGQCAWLITGGLLVLAASVLFAGVMIASDPGPGSSIIAISNAALFYLWGMGCIRYVHKTWTTTAARLKSVETASPADTRAHAASDNPRRP